MWIAVIKKKSSCTYKFSRFVSVCVQIRLLRIDMFYCSSSFNIWLYAAFLCTIKKLMIPFFTF